MDYCVFVHTKHLRMIGAMVSQCSMRENRVRHDAFAVIDRTPPAAA